MNVFEKGLPEFGRQVPEMILNRDGGKCLNPAIRKTLPIHPPANIVVVGDIGKCRMLLVGVSLEFFSRPRRSKTKRKIACLVVIFVASSVIFLASGKENKSEGWSYYRSSPGMMGMVPGMWTRFYALPIEKQEQLRRLQVGVFFEATAPRVAKLRTAQLELAALLKRFPVDRKAVPAKWRTISQTQRNLFETRVDMIARMQKITGAQFWSGSRK